MIEKKKLENIKFYIKLGTTVLACLGSITVLLIDDKIKSMNPGRPGRRQ